MLCFSSCLFPSQPRVEGIWKLSRGFFWRDPQKGSWVQWDKDFWGLDNTRPKSQKVSTEYPWQPILSSVWPFPYTMAKLNQNVKSDLILASGKLRWNYKKEICKKTKKNGSERNIVGRSNHVRQRTQPSFVGKWVGTNIREDNETRTQMMTDDGSQNSNKRKKMSQRN